LKFEVTVNGLRGEARLTNVTANVRGTTLQVHGTVAENPASRHRETALDFNISRGRAEDVLWLFSNAAEPARTGASPSGDVRVPQFGAAFLKNLKLKGHFDIRAGPFRKSTQAKVNELSARASGKKIKKGQNAPEVAVEQLSSEFTIVGGTAHLNGVFFQVPGARVRADGTYKLDQLSSAFKRGLMDGCHSV
jgi:hypothetical protein